jgi:hypothetical protein
VSLGMPTHPRKSQYVTQLRKWDFRKYIKDTDSSGWKIASHKVTKAKKSGKKVCLHHDGDFITENVPRTRGYPQQSTRGPLKVMGWKPAF